MRPQNLSVRSARTILGRTARVLEALRGQTIGFEHWEVLLIDNVEDLVARGVGPLIASERASLLRGQSWPYLRTSTRQSGSTLGLRPPGR
jgi:hypothetical protein